MNPKAWFFLGFLIFFGAFLFFARKGRYDQFHNAAIKGKIDSIYRYRDYVMIFIDSVEYRIIPVAINGAGLRLEEAARKGDSIIKPANNDTLIIKPADDVFARYLYTVKTH
jgi:hypothetical protein